MLHSMAGLALFIVAAGFAAPAVAQDASLAGTWKLHAKESDHPNEKLQATLEKGPTVVDGMRSGGGRMKSGAGRLDRPESGSAGGKLTVERKLGSTGSIREVFTMDAAKKRLVVEAKLTSAQLQGSMEIRRVYDAGN